ncbi:MAG: hypothetical protein L6Q55_08065 [Azonexus sp.]|nr:hypothetical protein [Azonexus sp.]MCK6412364.1 hypothetical protein [Azonexus sp.]
MKRAHRFATGLLLAGLLAGCAGHSAYTAYTAAPVRISDGLLTGSNGMTLYTFDKDSAGKSSCNGPCASNWPPLLATPGDTAHGDYSLTTRDDGRQQWTYRGKPLYFWIKDQKPGDQTGDGFNGVWRVAKP